MEFSIAQEVYVFLWSVFSGMLICIVYDLLRVIRSSSARVNALTDVQDILFWGIAVIIMFFTVFYTNHGEVRWFEFFGAFLGAILYFFTLSKAICYILKKFIEIFLKIFVFFCKILLTPLLFTYNIIYKSVLFTFVPIFRLLVRLFSKISAHIKTDLKMLKNALIKK